MSIQAGATLWDQGDVLLHQQVNNGTINVEGGLVEMTGSLDTAVYISLFGGVDTAWWGDAEELKPERRITSLTESLLKGLPASPANLRRVEEAARQDLRWLTDEGIAKSVTVTASIPDYKKISISGSIDDIPFEYTENWGAA